MAVAFGVVAMARHEVIFRQFENDGYENKELLNDLLVNMRSEVLDFGFVTCDNKRVSSCMVWVEFGDIVYLGIVKFSWSNFLMQLR